MTTRDFRIVAWFLLASLVLLVLVSAGETRADPQAGWLARSDAAGNPNANPEWNRVQNIPQFGGTRRLGGLVKAGDQLCFTAVTSTGSPGEEVQLVLSYPDLKPFVANQNGMTCYGPESIPEPGSLDGGNTLYRCILSPSSAPVRSAVFCMTPPPELVTRMQGHQGGQWNLRAFWQGGETPYGTVVDVGVVTDIVPARANDCPFWWQLARVEGDTDWDVIRSSGQFYFKIHPGLASSSPHIPSDTYYYFVGGRLDQDKPRHSLRRVNGTWVQEPCPGIDEPAYTFRIDNEYTNSAGQSVFDVSVNTATGWVRAYPITQKR